VRAALLLSCALAAAFAAGTARADDDPFGPSAREKGKPPPPERPETPPDPRAFAPWLEDEDWVCRALAAHELQRRDEEGATAVLAAALARETEPKAAAFLLKALAGRARDDLLVEGGPALVDGVLPWIAHAHPVLRSRALAVLEPLPPVRLGTEPSRYLAWWPKGREGLEAERALATERRAAAKAATKGPAPLAPDEAETRDVRAIPRWRDLERIRREGLEVVVALDQTGSMGEVIGAAKANVRELLRRLRSIAPKVRVGLVTYDDAAYVRALLTTDEDELERALKRVEAAGGEDYEEGVDKAIRLAAKQEKVAWSRKAQRVVVVVGDAPPHEDDFEPLLRAIAAARADPDFDAPLRVDTVSTAQGSEVDADGLVPHFAAIARAGHGSALRLRSTRDLVAELVTSSFGPSWRDAVKALLEEVDAFERAAPAPARSGR
jgi:Mg-chelatase subunit ChlD